MATIIGIRSSSFKGEDGVMITGKNIYLTEPLEKGEGHSAERVFLTDAKLLQCQYNPKVGDEVRIEYGNRASKNDLLPVSAFAYEVWKSADYQHAPSNSARHQAV